MCLMYSEGLNTEHWNTEHIGIPNVLKFWFPMFCFPMVQKQDGRHIISLDHFKYKYNFSLYIKWSRLMKWRPSCFWTIGKPNHSTSERPMTIRIPNAFGFRAPTVIAHDLNTKQSTMKYNGPEGHYNNESKSTVFFINQWVFTTPDFRSYSKSGPFANQSLFDHSKSRQVQISDPHCTYILEL